MRLNVAIDEVGTARRVLRLAAGERRSVLIVGLLGLAGAVFEGLGLSFLIPLARLVTGEPIDFDIPVIGPVLGWLDGYVALGTMHVVLLAIGFFVLGILVGYLNLVVSTFLAMRFAHDLRRRVFGTAMDRPLSQIESLPSGKFINNLASETWRVCDALFAVISVTVRLITVAVFFTFLMAIAPFYTLVLIAMTAVMALVVHLTTRQVRRMGAEAVAANEAFMAYVWDALGGLRVIRGFGREPHERARFADSSHAVRVIFTRMRLVSGLVGPITQIMTVTMVAVILGIAVMRGDGISTLIGFLAIAYRMQPRVASILGTRTHLRALEASIDAIEEAVADNAGSPPRGPDAMASTFPGLRRAIVLEGVSARYPNAERPALHDISCTIPFGQVTAIAGYSGAGKSTLVALLLRFIEPERGRILVDGVPLERIAPESWHRRIAFVEQNAFLFNATVRENIGYGDLEADLPAIREAARVAQADAFIDALPKGYETPIGENGVRLSQGQRQRVALARSLLRRPDVLILDEATNALDRPTERALRDAIRVGGRDRAVIVIAHRRETIESANHVIVIDEGRIVEAGSPAALARAGGVYARLYLDDVVAKGA